MLTCCGSKCDDAFKVFWTTPECEVLCDFFSWSKPLIQDKLKIHTIYSTISKCFEMKTFNLQSNHELMFFLKTQTEQTKHILRNTTLLLERHLAPWNLVSPRYQSFKTYSLKHRKRYVIKIMLTQGPLTSIWSSQPISEQEQR